MNRIGLLALCAALAAASAAAAQPAAPTCAGSWQVIRVSKIKPGKMGVFMDAVKDQQAWYKAKGLPDRILVGQMAEPGGGFSMETVISVHDKTGPAPAPHAGDAAWDAFVAKFRDSSDITAGGPVCVTAAPG